MEKADLSEKDEMFVGEITISLNGQVGCYSANGNGRLNCVSNALKQATGLDYSLESYTQHAVEEHTTSMAASYVSIQKDGVTYWGVGMDNDISSSSIKALVSAVNKIISA